MEIDSYELRELMKKESINLIDIRDYYSYCQGSIEGSIHIPYQSLSSFPEKYLKKDQTYYIFCNHGSNSRRLRDFLLRRGFDIVNIRGGYIDYKDSY